MIKGIGHHTLYTIIAFALSPKEGVDPFASATASTFRGNFYLIDQLRKDYYYVVYFTSKIVDASSGASQLQVNRFYSTET